MSAKDCDRQLNKFTKYAKCFLIDTWKCLLIRMLRVTLKKLFCVLSFIIVLYWLWGFQDCAVIHKKLESPVILWWTTGFSGIFESRLCPNNIQCEIIGNQNGSEHYDIDAYLFYASAMDFDNLPLPRKPSDIWGLYHEESPRNVEELMHEETLNLFNFSSTFSRYSDVPFPLQYLDSIDDITSRKYFVSTSTKNSLEGIISPVLYLQTDCETSTERDVYVKELMKYIDVDSYGVCLNNKEMPEEFQMDYLNKLNDEGFLHFIARYKFVLALENGVCEDYITEKFWRAIKVGNVPIYFGSPSIRDWLPNKQSAILLEDYPSPKKMSEYLKLLIRNDSLYDAHLEHKTKAIIRNEKLLRELKHRQYQTDVLEVVKKFECFVCKKIHEKKLGYLSEHVVNKKHYNCPEPISALTLTVNPANSWVYSWQMAKAKAVKLKKLITQTNT